LEVPLKCGLGGDGAPIRAALIESLIKYLLFVRSQLPKRYEELAADAAQADAPSKRGNALAIQRRGRCLGSAENLFDAVRALMRDTPPDMAAVVIGHSATLPKEVYVFRFAVADGDAAAAVAAELEPAAARDSARRVLRKLVTEVEAQFEGVRRPMKTWLFVHQREADGEGDERAVCAGAASFAPRPGFRVALNKSCHVVTIDIGAQDVFDPRLDGWPGVVLGAPRKGPPRRVDVPSAAAAPAGASPRPSGEPCGDAELKSDDDSEGEDMDVVDGDDGKDDEAPASLAVRAGVGGAVRGPTCQTQRGVWLQCSHVIAGFS
jgi:hypothetical protein